MVYSQEELKVLAAKAATLSERFRGNVQSLPDKNNAQSVQKRMIRWRQTVSGDGNLKAFRFRLAQDKLKEAQLRPYLGRVEWAPNVPLPEWTFILNQILGTEVTPEAEKVRDRKNKVPFEEILLPFVAYAQKEIKGVKKTAQKTISPQAWRHLEQGLLRRLGSNASYAFGDSFRHRQIKDKPLLALLGPDPKEPESKKLYGRFTAEMLDGGSSGFFKEYPVLARLLVTAVRQWLDSVFEFALRVHADWREIQNIFFHRKKTGRIYKIEVNLSDPHHDGRTVMILEFESGSKLVYKPKDLVTEESYFGFLKWLNKQKILLPLKELKVVNHHQYGWVEYAGRKECRSEKEVKNYYTRCGMLLSLLHLLDGTDAHMENIVNCGEHPIFIDLESLMQPVLKSWGEKAGEESATFFADQKLNQSVLRTGMLPVWIPSREGKAYDTSALAPVPVQHTGYNVAVWKKINTDQMHLAQEESVLRAGPYLLRLKGKKVSVFDYQKELMAGFKWMYRFFMKRKKELLGSQSPLRKLEGCRVRYIYRPTNVYALLGLKLLEPPYLKDGADRSIEIEVLTRNMIAHKKHNAVKALKSAFEAERTAFDRLDIPCFTARTDDSALRSDGHIVFPDFFQHPSYGRVRDKVKSLSESDLTFQTKVIQSLLLARFFDEFPKLKKEKEPGIFKEKALKKESFLKAAESLGDQLEKEAIKGENGDMSWLTLGFLPLSEKMTLIPLPESLYDGRMGVALFFGALFRVTGKMKYREWAKKTVHPLRTAIKNEPARRALIRRIGLGGTDGAGGLVYGFVKLAEFLKEKPFIKDAESLLDTFSVDQIGKDLFLDLSSGAAGGILGLSALFPYSRNKRQIKERAIACGNHLLKNRVQTGKGHSAWVLPGQTKALSGMSHGAAGIALSLLKLFELSGKKEFHQAAIEAIEYETTLFSKNKKNWADLRGKYAGKPVPPHYASNWCHGAPGIGLARLAGFHLLHNEKIEDDIQAALFTTMKAGVTGYDHLCCGTFGRVDLLIELSQKIDYPEILLEARKRGSWSHDRAQKKNGWRLIAALDHTLQSPSLYMGISGIGYQLLRLAEPAKLPSILSFD